MKDTLEIKSNAHYYIDFSKLARENEADLKDSLDYPDHLYFIENKNTDTQCFVYYDKAIKNLIIAFRGSQQFQDWLTDFTAFHLVYPYNNKDSKIKVHKGFITCYKSVREQILCLVDEYIICRKVRPLFDVVVCGHSLGGALATLCAVDLQYNFEIDFKHNHRLFGYASGNPSVFNKEGAKSFNKRVPNFYRTYVRTDWVPYLPPKWFGEKLHGGYRQCGVPIPIGPKARFEGLRTWVKFLRTPKTLAENLTNHAIPIYKNWLMINHV